MGMKLRYAVSGVAFGLVLSLPARQLPADTLALSLDQCITIALSENPTIKVADMEIERMDYSKKETLGQLLPTINFGANYNRMVAKQVAYMNMDFGSLGGGGDAGQGDGEEPENRLSGAKSSAGRDGIKMGLDNSYQVGFNATLPLIAPQLWASLKLSDSQILQNIEDARSSRLSLVNQIKSAYYSLLLAEDSYLVIRENYDNAVFNHGVFEKKFQVGTASEYDVLRSSVQVKNVEPELLQAEIAIKQARMQLAILMGIDTGYPVKPTVKLADYEKDMYENALSIDKTIDGNSDLRKLSLQTRTLEQALKVQKAAWFPTLAFTANYNWTSSSNGNALKNFRWNPYSVVGLTLSIPIFEGGQRYSRIKQSRIQVDEMKWQRDNLERSVRMQVDLAVDNINKNVKQISSSSESVTQAVKAYAIMEKSFEIGAASYLDLRDAELALTQARLSYYQSIYNYLVANSELELLLGNADLEKYKPVDNK
ncbi:TolC family protein [bacterium J10(2018)]|jgi:outer membrane protein TolC|nr:TolC family protein [bacterium J10(2018)]